LSFGDAIPSDHHAIWLDLKLPEVCPVHQELHIKALACQLQCKDPRIVERYNSALLDMLMKQNIPQRIKEIDLLTMRPSDLRRNLKKELNAIDNIITAAKRGAENHCRKLKCGQVQWCPQVTAAINKILFWKSILKQESSGKVGLSILKKQAKKAGIDQVPYPGTYPIPVVKTLISKAYKRFRHLKKDDTRRDSWIAQLIAAQASAWNRPKNTLWKQLCSMERIWWMAKNVRQALHKLQAHSPLALVEAPGRTPGTRQVYHQKVELEQACLEEAGRRFTQAKQTPFLTTPIVDIFSKCGKPKEVT